MVVPKYIHEILNEVQYRNDENGSCRMEEVETRFMCFWYLISEATWMIWSIMYTMICTYPDMSYALKCCDHESHKMTIGQ
jgi:hypothetical protein